MVRQGRARQGMVYFMKKITTIYIEQDLFIAAKTKCFTNSMTFTKYIQELIKKDLRINNK